MTTIDETLARACEAVPGLRDAVLILLPEGELLGAAGGTSQFDLEPLIRSARRSLMVRAAPAFGDAPPSPFVEYIFVIEDQYVVVQGGRSDSRVALAVVCDRETNLAFVLASTRRALTAVEAEVDLAAWGCA